MKKFIQTDSAPKPIGTYSHAVKVGETVYVSGQIPVNPDTMELISGFSGQVEQVFKNLSAIAEEAGGSLKDFVKFNVYLMDFNNFSIVNEIMSKFIDEPYPARAVIQVAGLPKGALIEIEGTMVLE